MVCWSRGSMMREGREKRWKKDEKKVKERKKWWSEGRKGGAETDKGSRGFHFQPLSSHWSACSQSLKGHWLVPSGGVRNLRKGRKSFCIKDNFLVQLSFPDVNEKKCASEFLFFSSLLSSLLYHLIPRSSLTRVSSSHSSLNLLSILTFTVWKFHTSCSEVPNTTTNIASPLCLMFSIPCKKSMENNLWILIMATFSLLCDWFNFWFKKGRDPSDWSEYNVKQIQMIRKVIGILTIMPWIHLFHLIFLVFESYCLEVAASSRLPDIFWNASNPM